MDGSWSNLGTIRVSSCAFGSENWIEMSYAEQRLLVVLKEAIDEEIGQQQKYAQRAEEAKDPWVKSLFQYLLEEEKKHEAALMKEFEKMKAQLGDKILSDIE